MQEEQLFGVSHGTVTSLNIGIHQDERLGAWITVIVHWVNRKPTHLSINLPQDLAIGDALMPWHGLQASVYKLYGKLAGPRIRWCLEANIAQGCEVATSGSRLPR